MTLNKLKTMNYVKKQIKVKNNQKIISYIKRLKTKTSIFAFLQQ